MLQELLNAYAEIVRAAPSVEAAAAHLANLLLDAQTVEKYIQAAIDAAKQRASQ
jgi:hypothetical protein